MELATVGAWLGTCRPPWRLSSSEPDAVNELTTMARLAATAVVPALSTLVLQNEVIRRLRRKEMKITQTYSAALIAIHTIDSEPQRAKSAIRGVILRVGLAFLAFTLVVGTSGCTNVSAAQDERSVRALGDTFANAFVQKTAELRASLFAEDGTFVTPQGDFLQGRVAMVKDFGPEAQQAVNGSTQAAFSNYRVRFIKRDVAVVRRAPYRAQCQRSKWDDHPRDTDQL